MAQETVMNFKTRLSVLILSTPVLAFVLVGGFMGKASAGSDDQGLRHLRVFEDVVSLVMSNYVEEVKIDKAMEGALRGLADGLDPDSAYLNAAQVKQIEAGDKLPEGDVGIELTRQYYLRVIAARDGSPAAKAGLQTGDYVRAVDGRPTREMSVFEGARLLRGQPGSKVTLTIIRGNAAEPHEVALVRERAAAPAVTSRMLDAATGYVRIPAFSAGAADQLKTAVASLTKAGATSLVIDIRRTAEGSFEHAIQAARLFVKSGTIAMKGGRDPKLPGEKVAARAGDGEFGLPVSLLVTAGTSGAAEVFAAALDATGRADVVGEQTLGRAGLQKLVKLPENRGLWLTYARYLTPTGEPLHGKGIEPDLPVNDPDVEFGAAAPQKDPILDAAIERLKTKKAA
jgi:carboxyl-terminal processing protease